VSGAAALDFPGEGTELVEAADFVLVVCTEVCRRRFDGTEEKRSQGRLQ
jgi:hypothetical protein